ncbi:PP2C family protein-serine/threonine phosphatase [Streptomyces cacaoi]|uniref:PP2C family protein-serine/threonine phosphatase n=1 Tax=Streptomyces cacaoi TaxID=1898 RepID=UPI003749ED77
MARWFEAFRSPATVEPTGSGGAPAGGVGVPSPLGVLRSAAARIGTTLDEDTTCAELTREVAGQVGAAAAVLHRRGEAGSTYEAVSGNPEVLPDARWAATAARERAGPPGESGVVHLASGGSRPALRVPLAINGHRYGVLVCAREGAPFTREEAELVTFLAERAASNIRHAREHDAVSGIVGKLQRALLAEPGRPHPNLDVAIRYLPVGQRALVGGDWCETVRLHFGRTLLVVGDVMGHGLEAAVDMAAYRSSLRYIASADLPPHRVLRQLDDIASREPDRRPATCLIARVDPVRGLVTLASAGHLPPAVIDGQGRASLLPVQVGPPLGTGLGGYEPATCRLDPSQALMLFTDGLVERRGEDIDDSLHRLASLSFSAATDVEDILDTVLARLDARHAEDDVAVMAARLRHRPAPA